MYSSIHQFQGCSTDFSTFPVPMLFWICMPICNVQLEGNLFCLNLSSKGRHLYHNVSPLTFDKDLSVYCTLDSKSLCSSTCYIGQNVCCVSDLIAFYDTNIFALKKTMLELGFKMHTFNWNVFLHLYNCGHPWTMHLIFMWVYLRVERLVCYVCGAATLLTHVHNSLFSSVSFECCCRGMHDMDGDGLGNLDNNLNSYIPKTYYSIA